MGNESDCSVGQTIVARPASSGAKHSGMSVGRKKPVSANPIASRAMRKVVASTRLRKLRKRSCSRSAAELAARTAVTMVPRSSHTIRNLSVRDGSLFSRAG